MELTNFTISINVPSNEVENFALHNGWLEFGADGAPDISAEEFIEQLIKKQLSSMVVEFQKHRIKIGLQTKEAELKYMEKEQIKRVEEFAKSTITVESSR